MADYISEFKTGQVIGSYTLQKFVSASGFMEMWTATHPELSDHVLLKILAITDYLQQFRQKMFIQSKLSHPAILQVLNLHTNEAPAHVVMENIEGNELASNLKVRGVLPEKMALEIAKQVLESLLYSHSHGIHHENLHLNNIYVDDHTRVKVTDFGLDFPKSEFSAPEQKPRKKSDMRSDLYSMGAILVKVLTGFDIQSIKIPELKDRNISDETLNIITRSLARKKQRYQRASEMLEDVDLAVVHLARKSDSQRKTFQATENIRDIRENWDQKLKHHAIMFEKNGRFQKSLDLWREVQFNNPDDSAAEAAVKRLVFKLKEKQAKVKLPERNESKPSGGNFPRANLFLRRIMIFCMFVLIGVICVFGVFLLRDWQMFPVKESAAVIPVQTPTPAPTVTPTSVPVPTVTPRATITPRPTATPVPPTPSPTRTPKPQPAQQNYGSRRRNRSVAPSGFVYIHPGSFYRSNKEGKPEMSPGSRLQRIWLTQAIYMAESEVTQDQWWTIMGSNPSQNKGSGLPVESITWFEAIDFCNKMSLRDGLNPCYHFKSDTLLMYTLPESGEPAAVHWNRHSNGYRLPTEAEWEYACRAGTQTRFSWGDYGDCNLAMAENDTVASEDSCSDLMRQHNLPTDSPIQVKSYPANPWKLYDMHGNVQEWCWDWYSSILPNEYNPIGPSKGTRKVIRGGSWNDIFSRCTSSSRERNRPQRKSFRCGLRLVLDAR